MAEGGGMSRKISANDQFLVRVIRRKIEDFNGADNEADRQRAVMAMSALSAAALIGNRQMTQSTLRYIESRL